MKVEVFQSDKGDCLLVTGSDNTRILVDGGMRSSYSKHVAPALGRIARDDGKLDLVYVSHIDQDHISGILQLFEDELAWRVRDFQHSTGNSGFRGPERPRPTSVQRIWHNAFSDFLTDNAGPIEDAVAAEAAVLEAGGEERGARPGAAQPRHQHQRGHPALAPGRPGSAGRPRSTGSFKASSRWCGPNGRRSGWGVSG